MGESKQAHLGFIALTFLLLFWHPTPIRASEGEVGFDFKEGSEKGPERWGELKKEWGTCKDGKRQSPIDIRDEDAKKLVPSLEDLQISYKPSNATINNEAHAISIKWEGDAGSIRINGTDFFLKQCHWHSPSEHALNGRRYDLEFHMVHRSQNNNLAVVGFLYKIGKPNPFLSQVRKDLLSMIDTKKWIHLGVADPLMVKSAQVKKQKKKRRSSSKFYRYMGSLTTPPCTEGVTWTINKQVHTVSRSQVKLLQRAVFDYAETNERPLQPLNGRDIKLYDWQNQQTP